MGYEPRTRRITPLTTCKNCFHILSDQDNKDDTEGSLVGNSMVQGQLTDFCIRVPRTRKRYCIPIGSVDDVIANVDNVTSLATDKKRVD